MQSLNLFMYNSDTETNTLQYLHVITVNWLHRDFTFHIFYNEINITFDALLSFSIYVDIIT